jgi:hypothetical protein
MVAICIDPIFGRSEFATEGTEGTEKELEGRESGRLARPRYCFRAVTQGGVAVRGTRLDLALG